MNGCVNPGFTNGNCSFCHVFKMSVIYKIGQNGVEVIFPPTVLKNYHILSSNYFVINIFSKSFVSIMFTYVFSKNYSTKQLNKEKSFIIVLLTSCCVLHYFCKSKKSAFFDERFQKF